MFMIGGALGTLEAHVFPAVVPWSAVCPVVLIHIGQ